MPTTRLPDFRRWLTALPRLRVRWPRTPTSRTGSWARSVLAWAGAAGLVGLVFVAAFYAAMRFEMRSTEVRVPDLSGLSLEQAAQRVEPLGLVLQVVEQRHDPAVPSDRILQQVPREGASVRRGRKLKLVLSLGDQVLEVPRLVGQAARTVAIELQRDGFTPGFEVQVPLATVPAGTVAAQVPLPGTPTLPSTRVHRLVSSGPAPRVWVMPSLVGFARERVERWAARQGLRVAVRSVRTSSYPPGEVIGQLPLAGYPLRAESVVELTVAQ